MIDIKKLYGNIQLTKTEETILTYFIENIDICANSNIRELSKKLYTSPSTIIRLAKKLGYSGFVELMYSLKNKHSKNNAIITLDENNKRNIYTLNYKDAEKDFLKCIENENILISGEGFSEIVSKYIYMKLLVIGKKSIFSTFIDFDILFDNHAENIHSIILVSKSGEGTHCVNSCQLAKERNITIVSFTGNAESTLAKNSDIVFLIPDCEKLDSDNYYPNPFFAYCIETFEIMIHKYFKSQDKDSKF
ncbi:MAG: MurR/RpiR family transcriptional regulator [Clostridium sp.]|nr:MurR/RpiR family transcriptional regulator [Clostridium sp.]